MAGGLVLADLLRLTRAQGVAQALGSVSGAVAIDLSLGDVISLTCGANPTTLSFTNVAASGLCSTVLLIISAAAGNIAWGVTPKWPAATAPTWTAGVDIVVLTTVDGGTTWYGVPSCIGAA